MFKKITKTKTKTKTRRSARKMDAGTRRILVVAGLWAFGLLLVVGKLYQVQIRQHEFYKEKARSYIEHKRTLQAARGTISDRNGEPLAVDLMHYSLAAKPAQLVEKRAVARKISKIINESYDDVYSKINNKKSFVYLAHRLTPEQAAQIRDLSDKSLLLERKFSRSYPFKEVGAHLVGYCDNDNKPGAGIEFSYDEYLHGKDGSSIFLRDAHGGQFPSMDLPTREPQNGKHIETTIDIVYQGILEAELGIAVNQHKADNGSAVLLNPRTGEVLAMANYPQFNPNEYSKYPVKNFKNQAVSDLYEPGSTFKMVSLAMCLEQLHLNMDSELVFCENGRYQLAQKTVRDHQKFAYLTARQVYENSSNVGVIKLAEKFPAAQFYRYARDFGFGEKTGIDLPAEINGILHKPDKFSKYSVSYMSIGYEVGVTPLQLASAYAAVANDGKLMQPYVVRRVVDESGRVVKENRPTELRTVISRETARQMKEVLKGVVENGTGQSARVTGVTIAGKTGTAQKIDRSTNSYTSENHIASFAGFFPVENPKFVLLVVVNNPRNGQYYGSQVAAPVFRRIAQRIVGLAVEDEPVSDQNLARIALPEMKNMLPAVEGMSVKNATKTLEKRNLKVDITGDGDTVFRQEPEAFSQFKEGQLVTLYTETRPLAETGKMPMVVGKSMKEALRILGEWDVQVEIEGSGIVIKQLPVAGSKMDNSGKIKLICNPA